MHFPTTLTFLSLAAPLLASPIDLLPSAPVSCTPAQQIAGVRQELVTISSHSPADAAKIPLAPLASRTFIVLPDELQTFFAVPVPVKVGVTADTVRAELVALATVLDAEVENGPDAGATYTVNSNGTVTVDYVQLNRIALPRVDVREIHTIDQSTCQITKILGYVRGPLV